MKSNLTYQKKHSSTAVSRRSEEKEMYLDTFDWVRPLRAPGSRPDDIQGLIHTASVWRPAVILKYARMKEQRNKWGGKRDSQEGLDTGKTSPSPVDCGLSYGSSLSWLSGSSHLLPGLITSSLIVPSHPLPQAPCQHLQAIFSSIRHFLQTLSSEYKLKDWREHKYWSFAQNLVSCQHKATLK